MLIKIYNVHDKGKGKGKGITLLQAQDAYCSCSGAVHQPERACSL